MIFSHYSIKLLVLDIKYNTNYVSSFHPIILFATGFAHHGLLTLLVVHYLIFLSPEVVSTSLHYQILLQFQLESLFEDKV